jgi:predicted 3-demethylubiquinone-9 3-methyltransferase (glyoxalase superfamily)
MSIQKINTFLWFDTQAEEAANFYVSLFKNSQVKSVSRYPAGVEDVTGKQAGAVMTVTFQLDGQEFIALNGGPQAKFTEAVSLFVNCETQEEIDELWGKLTEGGSEVQCGWLKDKYGLFWQIAPPVLLEMLHDEDREKAGRVMKAMLQMKKIDVRTLKQAYEQA